MFSIAIDEQNLLSDSDGDIEPVLSIAFSPDGTIKLWNVAQWVTVMPKWKLIEECK